jgi:hypothetical protein
METRAAPADGTLRLIDDKEPAGNTQYRTLDRAMEQHAACARIEQ